MKTNKLMMFCGLVLLAIVAAKQLFPGKTVLGKLSSELAQAAVDVDGYIVNRDDYLALNAYSTSWQEAQFQSDTVEFFQYSVSLNQKLSSAEDDKHQNKTPVRAVKLVGEIKYLWDVPLGCRTFVDLKTLVFAPGHPEPYLRARVENKGEYFVGLVRLSDALPKPFTRQAVWAPTEQLVPPDQGTEVISTYRAVVQAGQWTEPKTIFIPQNLVNTAAYAYWLNIQSIPQASRPGSSGDVWEYVLNGKTSYLLDGDMKTLSSKLAADVPAAGAELSLHLLQGGPARAAVVITVYRQRK